MNKRIQLLCIMILTSSVMFFSSYGHSGNTDSNGGHYDRSTGVYHYHHGYSAHQHPDGVCPYEAPAPTKSSNDSKDYNVYSSLKSSRTRDELLNRYKDDLIKNQSLPTETSAKTVDAEASTDNNTTTTYLSSSFSFNWVFAILIFVCAFGNLLFLESIKKTRAELHDTQTQLKELQAKHLERQKKSKETLERLLADNKELHSRITTQERLLRSFSSPHEFATITDEEIAFLAKVPDGIIFDQKWYPHYPREPLVESHMHVYVSTTGTKYHRQCGCCGANRHMHLFLAAMLMEPCDKCIPKEAHDYKLPNWYFRYILLMSVRRFLKNDGNIYDSTKDPPSNGGSKDN